MTGPSPAPTQAEAHPPTAEPDRLPRRLGAPGLAIIILAFNAPIAAMAGFQQLVIGFGNGIGSPVAFLAAGVVLLLFAVGFIAMSRYIPRPGAFYSYIAAGLGKATGLGGAFLATVAYILLTAGVYPYMGLIAVDLMNRLFGTSPPWQVWAFIFLVIITGLGLLRIDVSTKVLGILVLFEIFAVGLWQAVVFIKGGPEGYSLESFSPPVFLEGTAGTLGFAVLFAMLTMIGIEGAACFRNEARDPDRSVRRATLGAIGFLMVFYALGTWVYIIAEGPSRVVDSALTDPVGTFFNGVQSFLGGFIANAVAVVLVTSQMAAMVAGQGAASRYLYSLSKDRIYPAPLSRVHPRLQSPYIAVLTVGGVGVLILAGILALQLDAVQAYAALSGIAIYFLLPLFMATCAAVIVYFRRHPEHKMGVWGATIAPALAFIALGALFVLTSLNLEYLVGTPEVGSVAVVAVVVTAAAGVILGLRYKKTRPSVYESIGTQEL